MWEMYKNVADISHYWRIIIDEIQRWKWMADSRHWGKEVRYEGNERREEKIC
jgi:hypothetical protein